MKTKLLGIVAVGVSLLATPVLAQDGGTGGSSGDVIICLGVCTINGGGTSVDVGVGVPKTGGGGPVDGGSGNTSGTCPGGKIGCTKGGGGQEGKGKDP